MHCNKGYVQSQFMLIIILYNILFLSFILFYFVPQETPEDAGWRDLVEKGFIEYIDTEEEETTMISMTINVSI